MWVSRSTSVILLLILLIVISSESDANHRWKLLENYESDPSIFKELEIGDKIVYWYQRKLGEATVELDQIVHHFDRKTLKPVNVIVKWRDGLPYDLPMLNLTKEQAESMVKGTVIYSKLYIISPRSSVFPIKPTPENPCWVVASRNKANFMLLTVIDAVEGVILGYGIPPPYSGFSLSGPDISPYPGGECDQPVNWTQKYQNAQYWFDEMGYSTEAAQWPTEDEVKSHIQSESTAVFYELAHSRYTWGLLFASGCIDIPEGGDEYEVTTASEIETWISNYTKMPFTFLASCYSMCDVSDDTLSYELRKGSTEDTATVGFCKMSEEHCLLCWTYMLYEDPEEPRWWDGWQEKFFQYLSNGESVKEAFDLADADFPACYNGACTRFAGDENFAVVPLVFRVYELNSHWKLDETSGTTAEDSVGDKDGTLTNMDPETDWVTGKIGGALDFDGDNDYVSIAPIDALKSNTVTISAWIKTDTIADVYHPIVSTYFTDGVNHYGYLLYVKKTAEPAFYEPIFYLAGRAVESNVSINTVDWYHIAGTYDGSDLKIYVNGELKGTNPESGLTGFYENYNNTYMGRDVPTSSYFAGIIDDVRVYNYALDVFEIWDAMSGDASRFRVKNSSGKTVAWFDSFGNLFLEGSLTEGGGQTRPTATEDDEFIFKDSSGNLMIINTTNGNMDIYGVHDVWPGPGPSELEDEFVIEGPSGAVAYINASGNLYLKGELYEQNP